MRIKSPGFRLGAASAVAFSHSGRFLGQVGRRVAIYSVPARKVATRSDWHYAHPAAIAFGAADDWFAVRSTTGAMAVAAVADGHPLNRLPPATDTADDSGLFNAPGDHLVEACASGTLRVRHIKELRIQYVEQHPALMLGPVGVSADRSEWIFAMNARQLRLPVQPPCRLEIRRWPFETGNREIVGAQFGFVQAVALSSTTETIALIERRPAASASTVSIVSRDGRLLQESTSKEWVGHKGLARSPDGRFLVVGTADGHTLLDDHLRVVGRLAGEYSSDACFSPDGHLLALGYWGQGRVIATADLRSWFADRSAGINEAAV
jgi:hypothetical protein